MSWKRITDAPKIPGAHRFFRQDFGGRTPNPMKVWISDSSGRDPEQCDDGALWVDTSRSAHAEENGTAWTVPLRKAHSGKLSTLMPFEHVSWLSETVGLSFADRRERDLGA